MKNITNTTEDQKVKDSFIEKRLAVLDVLAWVKLSMNTAAINIGGVFAVMVADSFSFVAGTIIAAPFIFWNVYVLYRANQRKLYFAAEYGVK